MANSYVTDTQAQDILARLVVSSPDHLGYSLDQGVIGWNNRIWVGNNAALQTKLITALHSSPIRDILVKKQLIIA